MSGFSADWLALREGADTRARAGSLTERLAGFCRDRIESRSAIEIIDLGSGTGANLRFLAPRLKLPQHWTLVDQDASLLEHAGRLHGTSSKVEVRHCRLDLSRKLQDLDFEGVDVVTASALMDLVSAEWFNRLAVKCRQAGCAILFVLSYDGILEWDPIDPFDSTVRDLFNRHQAGNKGFGPALGPEAPNLMERTLRAQGYRVAIVQSDWELGSSDGELILALIEGIEAAALDMSPGQADLIHEWGLRRRGQVESNESRMRVGHRDLFAEP